MKISVPQNMVRMTLGPHDAGVRLVRPRGAARRGDAPPVAELGQEHRRGRSEVNLSLITPHLARIHLSARQGQSRQCLGARAPGRRLEPLAGLARQQPARGRTVATRKSLLERGCRRAHGGLTARRTPTRQQCGDQEQRPPVPAHAVSPSSPRSRHPSPSGHGLAGRDLQRTCPRPTRAADGRVMHQRRSDPKRRPPGVRAAARCVVAPWAAHHGPARRARYVGTTVSTSRTTPTAAVAVNPPPRPTATSKISKTVPVITTPRPASAQPSS